jgi:hypothetical protein
VQPDFNKDPRRQHELAMRPAIDKIYAATWPGCVVERTEREDDAILDKKHAIDVRVVQPNGMLLLGQEKALQAQYASFGTVTVEFMQDPNTNERGDWFHLASQFYFCGYATEDKTGFSKWVLLNWPLVVLESNTGAFKWEGPRDNSKSRARANFRHVKMTDIPATCIIAHSGFDVKTGVITKPLPVPSLPVKSPQQQIRELLLTLSPQDRLKLLGEVLISEASSAGQKRVA